MKLESSFSSLVDRGYRPWPPFLTVVHRVVCLVAACLVLSLGGCVSLQPQETIAAKLPPERYVEMLGTRIYCEDTGAGRQLDADGQDETLLLLHGFGASAHSWRKVIPELSERFRVVACDLPGFGLSERPVDPGLYGLEGNGRVVEALVDYYQASSDISPEKSSDESSEKPQEAKPIHLVGHSYGGGLAAKFAAAHPERVASLVLVDTTVPRMSRAPGSRFLTWRPLSYFLLRNIALRRPFVRMALRRSVAEPDRVIDRTLVDASVLRLRLKGPAKPYFSLTSALPTTRLSVDLGSLVMPTLIVWGQDDQLIPVKIAREAAASIPGSRLEIFENCGHQPMEEIPEAFVATLFDFYLQRGLVQPLPPHGSATATHVPR